VKLLVAIVRSEKLDAVRAALDGHQADLLAVSQVLGFGQEPSHTEIYRGRVFQVRSPRLRLEAVVPDRFAEAVVAAVVRAGCDGDADGKVFVMPLDECVRVRTGDGDALAFGN
jgi:nitrogen regulatory protein PII